MKTVFIVNPREKACGVAQFGLNIEKVLLHSKKFRFVAREPVTETEYRMLLDEYNPDFILWNYYPCTMPWVGLDVLNIARSRGLRQATIFHEIPITGFDAYIYPDETFERKQKNLSLWFPSCRALPEILPYQDRPFDLDNPVIGSCGFGFANKGHVRLVERVRDEFDTATLKMHIPFAKWGDERGKQAMAVVEWCRNALSGKPGIKLEFSHNFLEASELVRWLAANDLNAFLYDEMPGRGIASTTDFALMANRPIAITRTTMFRHMHDLEPSICVDDRSLREIMASGVEPLDKMYERNSVEVFCRNIETAVEETMARPSANRLLRDLDREELEWAVRILKMHAPSIMSRKIPEANVQQAWMLSNVLDARPESILSAGCYEDSAFEALRVIGQNVTGIDPLVNGMDLHKFVQNNHGAQFDCVFATSVLEHVQDDEQFIQDMCTLLKPDGVGLLTCDFREGWKAGDPVPYSDFRLYTSADIDRLGRVLHRNGCYWTDKPDTLGEPDFHYQGHNYSFMALAFKKL